MKEFKLSSLSIDNRTTIYVLTVIITLAGLASYFAIPKEQFPEVVFPQMFVTTVYAGTSPKDMENTVTKIIEKEVKSISGVKKVTSTSIQDFSSIIVEFNTNVEIDKAKLDVKDAVDRAKKDLPKDLTDGPTVMEIDVSQIPIMNVNVSGDFELTKLKKYAEILKDEIEGMKEITRVDMIGALDREIQIDVDKFKMESAGVSMGDIERAVAYENMTISGGLVKMDAVKRNISVNGEFRSVEQIKNLVIRSSSGANVYLHEIAEVRDGYKEKESYARLDKNNVITLNVIKKSGQNLIEASDKIVALVDELKATKFPENLKITITGDQSKATRVTVHDLINTIIIGFILVTIILMFFMGTTNAIFVALSVPLSMFIAFMILDGMDLTMNMIVLFAFLLALGIVVDDAIVVIENTHRIFDDGKVPIVKAAKQAAGEVFLPVLSGTVTTLAPFIPLLFWPGVMGEFMYYLPLTLIITLLASLFVAYIINPVFAVDFMKPHNEYKKKSNKGYIIVTVIFAALALIFYGGGWFGMGNFTVTLWILFTLNKFVFSKMIKKFQESIWPKVQNGYERLITWTLHKSRPVWLLVGTVVLLFLSFVITGLRNPGVIFFPQADPNFIYTYITLPIGTDQAYTDSITKVVEDRIFKVIGDNNPLVESVIANVAVGTDPMGMDQTVQPHKAKVTVAFVEFGKRNGESTVAYLDKIRDAVKGIPGTQIVVEQEQGGPPTGKPINIEISGDDFEQLIAVSEQLKLYLEGIGIGGVEELKSDLLKNKPEVLIEIDREKASSEGISTAQIGMEIRNAVFGKEVSKFRDFEDDYPIQLRYKYDQRNNIESLLNLKITYRDMNMGGIMRQVPLSSLAKVTFTDGYGGINRKNQKRVITLSSNVLTGYNPNEVVGNINNAIKDFDLPDGVFVQMTGEQEDQKETMDFILWALAVSTLLVFGVLVLQFNSVSKPVLILTEIVFSVIGVLLGFALFNMDFSVLMTGVGIVALAGIVVRNGILLVEFTDYLIEQGVPTREAIIQAGKIRMTPVLLTATATILGLIPLAVGLNIDFVRLFTELNPHIYFGGDNVAFWGPLSWTMIFGLAFATFLTLVLVPVMYLLMSRIKSKLSRKKEEVGPVESLVETEQI
ncbi:MAG TPA: efflux RND transporter permease subunit [Cytophagaceae bacterium]